MKLSSTQLEAFYAVARTGSFTRAAQVINVTQSALSQRVLNLEAEIQTTLFIRDRAGITLTEAAHELLRYCELQEKFESEFLGRLNSKGSELAGILRIAGFSTVVRSLVLPALAGLIRRHPGVQLSLQTKELHELLPMLKRGETDFVILAERLDRDEIESSLIGTERNVLIEAESYKGPDNVYLDHDEFDETTVRYLKMAHMPWKNIKRHYLDDIYGILDGVRHGLGRAVVPEHLLEKRKGLVIKQKNVALEVPVHLHYFRQPYYSRLHAAVVSALIKLGRVS